MAIIAKTTVDLWMKYGDWLVAEFPEGARALNPGATDDELAALQAAIGVDLPEDYRTVLRIHNGQQADSVGLLWGNEFLSTTRIHSEWQVMKQLLDEGHFPHRSVSSPENAIKHDWWSPQWIPITSDGSGNLQCLDLSPGPAGTMGQIIDFDHETVHRCVLASSFREAFQNYVKSILAGEYSYSDDYGRLIRVDEL
jgi:cell wall assembly regulator SMI1